MMSGKTPRASCSRGLLWGSRSDPDDWLHFALTIEPVLIVVRVQLYGERVYAACHVKLRLATPSGESQTDLQAAHCVHVVPKHPHAERICACSNLHIGAVEDRKVC